MYKVGFNINFQRHGEPEASPIIDWIESLSDRFFSKHPYWYVEEVNTIQVAQKPIIYYKDFDINIHEDDEFLERIFKLRFYIGGNSNDDVILTFLVNENSWPVIYSGLEVINVIEETWSNHFSEEDTLELDIDGLFKTGAQIHLGNVDRSITIEDFVFKYIKIFDEFIKDVLLQLNDSYHHSVITKFQFPKHIQTAAKQYLIYFSQFLADLGINANTEIQETAKDTLFTVTPSDERESLERIKEALALYLDSANLSGINKMTDTNDIAVVQWKAQVMFLQSQLELSSAVLQAKNETIEALKLSNYLLTNSNKEAVNDSEPVIKDIVNIKKYDGSWFDINLPEIVRKLKRRFYD